MPDTGDKSDSPNAADGVDRGCSAETKAAKHTFDELLVCILWEVRFIEFHSLPRVLRDPRRVLWSRHFFANSAWAQATLFKERTAALVFAMAGAHQPLPFPALAKAEQSAPLDTK